MDLKYDIIWVDDICNQPHGESYIKLFRAKGFNVHAYETRKEGLEALASGVPCQAIVLDGKCADDEEDQVMTEAGLLKMIFDIRNHYKIPFFILTGQPDLEDSTVFCKQYDYRVYKKGKMEVYAEDSGIKSMPELFEDIVRDIDAQPKKIIRDHYYEAFLPIDKGYIPKSAEGPLLDLLYLLHDKDNNAEIKPMLYYNSLRQIIEAMFRGANKIGLVPDQCIVDGVVNLNQSSLYMAGGTAKVIGARFGFKDDRIFPPYIETIVRSILELGNIHSHTIDLDEADTRSLEQFFGTANSRYLIFGFTLQVCEVFSWFYKYAIQHSDRNKNLSKCNIPHEVEQDENGNFHISTLLLPYSKCMKDKLLGEKLIVLAIEPNQSETNSKYPYFATDYIQIKPNKEKKR